MRKLDIAVGMGAFLITVAVAVVLRWEASDLIWASWISTLCVGSAEFLVSLASLFHLKGRFKETRRGCAILVLLWFLPWWAMFYLVFLPETLHDLFPLGGKQFGLIAVFRTSLRLYWPLVLTSFQPELVELWSYWRLAGRMSKEGSYPVLLWSPLVTAGRMLVFLYLLACLDLVGARRYALYPALLFYFFPWRAVPWGALFGPRLRRRPSDDPDQMVLRWGGGFFSPLGWAFLLAGLLLVSLPIWKAASRDGWFHALLGLYGGTIFYGLPFGAIGTVLAFGRVELTLDRKEGTYAWRHSLPPVYRWREAGKLKADSVTAVRIGYEDLTKSELQAGGEKLTLSGRHGLGRSFYCEVYLVRPGEDFQVGNFMSPRRAQALAQELATFYGVPVVADESGTEGSTGQAAHDRSPGQAR